MSARLLDGLALARRIRDGLAPEVAALTAARGRPPGLAIVLAGSDPASEVYVRNKLKAGAEVGLRADLERLPATATLGELLSLIERLNADDAYDGILVQSPLPRAMGPAAEEAAFGAVAPAKDVDGFTAENVGRLVQHRPGLVACTPSGVMALLQAEGIPIAGRQAVVIGRSDIVGKPMALLLLHADATVTICHSRTPDLAAVCRRADILVAAVGRPGLVRRDFVKPGATVVDVGTNTVTDRATAEALFGGSHARLETLAAKGAILVGDVHPEVAEVAGALTPVPGGVGPLTIALLMRNTLEAARRRGAGR